MRRKKVVFKSRVEQSRLSKRADGLDVLKFLCAFMIVCIHCPFPGIFGEYFIAITRIAVPIFFMITGFFYTSVVNRKRELLQIKKIAGLMIVSNLLYALWESLAAVLTGNGLMSYWESILTIKNMAKFILLNDSPFSSHLWYLGAILYVLIIAYLLGRMGHERILYMITPLLLIGDLILGKYSLLIFGREFPYILVRNFLFVGLPYFTIGRLIRDCTIKIKEQDKNKVAIGIGIFSITSLLERFLLVQTGVNATRDHYISTTFLAVFVFAFFLDSFSDKEMKNSGKVVAQLGREYSAGIYVIHPIFITVLSALMKAIGVYDLYSVIAPLVVFGVSILAVMLLTKIQETIKHKYEKNG